MSLEAKQRILSEMIDLMDQLEGEDLKKHPKFAVSKVEVENPEPGVDPVDGGGPVEAAAGAEEELSPELIQQLLEMHKDKQ
jgi:hypothetical protein